MKKHMILAAICGTLLLGGGLAAQAQPSLMRGGEFGGPSRDRLMCARGGSASEQRLPMFERLDLNEKQEKAVRKLLGDSIERSKKLHVKMREVRRQLRQATQPSKFDEEAFRKLASEKAAIETELMVERAKTHSRIYALLTPEQKELADLAGKLRRLQGHGPVGHDRPMRHPMRMKPGEAVPSN